MGEMTGYRELLGSGEYDFFRTDPHLRGRVILLGLGGSHAYGTNVEGSDIDIRGAALERPGDLIGLTDFEQFTDKETDTTVYGYRKLVKLLAECNPNVIEILGLKPSHYLVMTESGQELIDNTDLFLSRRAIASFGGYADAQLRRLQNALARDTLPQREREIHILHSVQNALVSMQERYRSFENGSVKVYVDRSDREDMETEIFMDVDLTHYPLRDYRSIWAEMNSVVKDYDKIGKRNHKKDDAHLNKHAMHLVRLFLMAEDILREGKVVTYREKEHDLLMAIRNGEYQKEDGSFREEFFDLVTEHEKKVREAAEHTALPDRPDKERLEALLMSAGERVIRDPAGEGVTVF